MLSCQKLLFERSLIETAISHIFLHPTGADCMKFIHSFKSNKRVWVLQNRLRRKLVNNVGHAWLFWPTPSEATRKGITSGWSNVKKPLVWLLADSQSSSMSFMTLTMDHMDHLSTLKSPLLVPPIVVISLYVMIRHNTSFLNLSRGRNGPNSRTGLWKDCLPKLQSPNGAFMEKSTIFTFSNEARWY